MTKENPLQCNQPAVKVAGSRLDADLAKGGAGGLSIGRSCNGNEDIGMRVVGISWSERDLGGRCTSCGGFIVDDAPE